MKLALVFAPLIFKICNPVNSQIAWETGYGGYVSTVHMGRIWHIGIYDKHGWLGREVYAIEKRAAGK